MAFIPGKLEGGSRQPFASLSPGPLPLEQKLLWPDEKGNSWGVSVPLWLCSDSSQPPLASLLLYFYAWGLCSLDLEWAVRTSPGVWFSCLWAS